MPVLTEQWDKILQHKYTDDTMKSIQARLKSDLAKGHTIMPSVPNIFNAYKATDFDKVKVLILGQSPNYLENRADGLAFSSPEITPELEIIFSDIKGSTGKTRTQTNLRDWADQGVFLLNTILTTVQGRALAHENIGWEKLTKYTIQMLDASKPMVVMLWGGYAIEFGKRLNGAKHLILKAPHPASDVYGTNPRTFRGCQHFSYCNDWMQSKGLSQINWGDPIKPKSDE